jgi:HD domain
VRRAHGWRCLTAGWLTRRVAIALGHDCGHGPGGHASEDAFDVFISQGYDHGPWGADVVLRSLNLCVETLDGIRNHSWSRPAPVTVEGHIVSWADRIAYCAHDLEDAIHAGIVAPDDLPADIVQVCGRTRVLDALGCPSLVEPMAVASLLHKQRICLGKRHTA